MEILTDTIKIDSGNTKMIAHRGASGLETENTNPAFIAAANRSYYGIECDVHVTADGKFPIIHDDNTLRVSGVDIHVENSTSEELKKIKLYDICRDTELNDIISEHKRSDQVIPFLNEYINICKKYNKMAVIELKNALSKSDIENIIDEIKTLEYLENVTFISFSRENVISVKKLEPKANAQFLTSTWDKSLVYWLHYNNLDLDIYYKALTKEIIDLLHKNNIRVNCWTVDNPKDANELISWGVDYITTNILE